jgi:hypothetical protein
MRQVGLAVCYVLGIGRAVFPHRQQCLPTNRGFTP